MGNKNSHISQRIKNHHHHPAVGAAAAGGRKSLPQPVSCVSHATQTTQWIPPTENWDAGEWRLPYGWECAADIQGRIYYINHIDKFTTYDDPRLLSGDDDDSEQDIPLPREVTLQRDSAMGFGFVAGSEKPVIVRFVNEDGPSAGKLLPSDLILRINGEDVEKAPRDHVIELVRSCKETVTLTVCQPQSDNASRKSAFLSAAKKARLKSKPSRVRFADGVVINGTGSIVSGDASQEVPPTAFIPNVLKVFLENGQTKSFKYDNKTTVKDVMNSLREKLSIQAIEHFALVVEHVKSLKKNQVKVLSPEETIAKIAARPGAQHLRCLFRITFIPRDAFELLRKDQVAFDYFYMQCCNDVLDERFATELRCDVALRLAALQMQQHGLCNSTASKVSIKRIEKDCGLEKFIPPSILEAMKPKELRRLLSHLMKVNNQQLCAAGQKKLTELQVKVHYLKILSELPTFGGRCFNVVIPETKNDGLILISPKFGVSQISGTKSGAPVMLAELESISEVVTAEIPDAFHSIELHIRPPVHERFAFEMESSDDLDDFVQLLNGYSKLFLGVPLRILVIDDAKDDNKSPGEPPAYYGNHVVYSMPWSYPAELKSITIQLSEEANKPPEERLVDFSQVPSSSSAEPVSVLAQITRQLPSSSSRDRLSSPPPPPPPLETQAAGPTGYVRSTASPPTHVEVNLTGRRTSAAVVGGGGQPLSDQLQPTAPDVVRNMRFIDDSTSSELDTPVAERALRRSNLLQDTANSLRESDVIRYRPNTDPYTALPSAESASPITPDLVKRSSNTTSRSSSNAELAAQLSRLQTPITTPSNGGSKLLTWDAPHHEKLEVPSDSDVETDSVSTTPTESPIHRATRAGTHRVAAPPSSLFRSGSSFGLHSPEAVTVGTGYHDAGFQVYIDNIAEIEAHQAEQEEPTEAAVGSMYLDPDIIDLCRIPIPEASNEVAMLYAEIEVPPTPFRDPLTPFPGTTTTTTSTTAAANPSSADNHRLLLDDIAEDSVPVYPPSPGYLKKSHLTPAPAEKSGGSLDEALDELNSFISAMTVPDPEDDHPYIHRVTSEDIRLLVIPPPPAHSPSRSGSSSVNSSVDRTVKVNGGYHHHHAHEATIPAPPAPVTAPVKPPIPPKPKVIPPPPPVRNKSLERKTNDGNKGTATGRDSNLITGLVSPQMMRRSGSRDIENTEAFKDCVAEINAQLCEIAIRRSGAPVSSESDLVSTTPSASEETTPVMWRKNPVLNCKTNRKPPPVGGVHPSATLPFATAKQPSVNAAKNRYRTRPPPREKLRKKLAAVRAQQADPMTNGGWDDEDEEPNWPPPPPRTVLSSGPSGVTRVEIGGSNNASTDNNPSLVPRHGHTHHNRGHETDAEVLERVSQIISQIDWTVDLVRRPDSIRPNSSRMRAAREDLISGAKRFVTASKALVKSATIMMSDSQGAAAVMEASEAPRNPGWTPGGNPGGNPGGGSARPTSLTGHKHMLFHESLVRCTDLVGMMFASAAEVAHCSPTAADAAKLVEGILLVAVAFRATVQAAFRPSRPGTVEQENSLHDPAVKVLMSEATKLAASLTTLMKTIRSLEGSSSAGMQNGDGPPTAAAAVMFGGEPHQQPQLHSKNAHQVVAMI